MLSIGCCRLEEFLLCGYVDYTPEICTYSAIKKDYD